MQTAPIPENESERLAAVHRLAILDTAPEKRFDKLTKEAAESLNMPISTISIIDENREWYKSCYGLDQKQGDRSISFCGHALLSSDIFIVEDTRNDPKFADNPAVVGPPYIRFYAGVALRDQKTNRPIGVFCVKDFKPRKLSIKEIGLIIEIANRAERELNTKG
mgnify:CR=1 FL=1